MGLSDITVVIVTFKSEHKIFSCIDSIPNNLKIIVVENSSDKNFKDRVENYRSNVECFVLNNNFGYAYANNFGLSKVKSKFGLVLNPDTRLTKNSIDKFLNTASNYKNFWLVGPDQNFEKSLSNDDIREAKNIKGYAMFFNIEKFNEIKQILKKHNNTGKIVAISKNHPAESVLKAINHGVYIFGENRVQEAKSKFTKIVKTNKRKRSNFGSYNKMNSYYEGFIKNYNS